MRDTELSPGSVQFPVGPFPVVVRPSFWLVMALFGLNWRSPVAIATFVGVAFVSILFHELGHAITGRLFGANPWIELYSFGGLTHSDRALSRWRDVVMSAAGPTFGFVLAAAASWALNAFEPHPVLRIAISQAFAINLYWGIMNILPILPLDGGRVMAGVLGPKRRRWALGTGIVVSAAVVAYGLLSQDHFLALIFAMLAMQNIQAIGAERNLKARPPPPAEPDALKRGWDALLSGDEHEANRLGHLALSAAKNVDQHNAVRDLLAWVALADNNPRHAMSQLERVTPKEQARKLTWALALEGLQLPDRALPYALLAYADEPSETSATLAIRLLVRAQRADEAQKLASEFAWRSPAVKSARLGDVALAQKRYAEAASSYAAAFESSRRPLDAYNAACAHARAGELATGAEWLAKALDAGFDDLDQLANDPDLEQIRSAPEIQSRLAKPA